MILCFNSVYNVYLKFVLSVVYGYILGFYVISVKLNDNRLNETPPNPFIFKAYKTPC